MKRVAIYARVSKAYKEDDDRITIEIQLSDCEAYCEGRGYLIAGRYVDKDKYRVKGSLRNPSGARKDRPAYLKMLKAARAGDFDLIVAWREDRLYRGMYAALPLVEALDERRNDLTVELVKETFDRGMVEIKAAIAKLELDSIRQRMIAGRRARLERGEVPGGPVRYGYRKKNKKLLIEESEAEVVRQIFAWYIEGENAIEIRRRLNAAEIPPRKNKLWPKVSIHNILRFEGYATGEYRATLDGEQFTLPCPPIISEAIWHKSLEVRQENRTWPSRNVKEDYLCRGMVTCSCGWTWNARTRTGTDDKYGIYWCPRRAHQPEWKNPDCGGLIGADKLDRYVWAFVLRLCQDPDIIRRAIDDRVADLQEERGDLEREADQMQTALDKLTEERQWVITQARKGAITEEDMEMQLAALSFQALGLRKEHEGKMAAIAAQNQAEKLKEWAAEYLSDIGEGLRILDADPEDLTEAERDSLYAELEAHKYEAKFDGDKLAALRWAILKKKRQAVRLVVDRIEVHRAEDGDKVIVPILSLGIPREYASLVYDDQSLDYRPWDDDGRHVR